MSRYPIETRVIIDGIEAYDKAADLAKDRPTVLDQLSLSWGRSTVVDQPDVGSCTLQIREQLHEAQREKVLATQLAPDPSFEHRLGGFPASSPNGTVTVDTTRVRTGSRSARFTTTGTGVFNPAIQIYGPGSRLRAGDRVTVRVWVNINNTARGQGRPQIRIGGTGITGINSPDFSGPSAEWSSIEVTATVDADGSSLTVYLYGSAVVGQLVRFDDLSITVNAPAEDFSGDTAATKPGPWTAKLAQLGDLPTQADYESWPMITVLPSGTWVMFHSAGSGHTAADTRVIISRSEDEGSTWTVVQSIGVDGEDWGNGQPVVTATGDLVAAIRREYGTSGEDVVYVRSTDDGHTFTEIVRYSGWPQIATHGAITLLDNGHLIQPWHGEGWGMIRSTDNGNTWTISNTGNGGPWMREGRIVQAGDGTLIGFGRNGNLDIYYSGDRGVSWTQGVDTGITPADGGNINTQAQILVGNRLELVWISRASRQMFYTVADVPTLLDDPTAWQKSIRLADIPATTQGDLGYPTLQYRQSGALYAAWYADPNLDGTPSICTGLIRTRQLPGEGDQYRWTGPAGTSPSQRYQPAIPASAPVYDVIRAGSTVEVWSRAGDVPPASDQVMTSGQFRDLGDLDPSLWNSDTTDLDVTVAGRFGRQSAWLSRGIVPWSGQVVFPPTPYAPADDPAGWDHVPRLLPGQQWQYTLTALIPPGTQAQLCAWAVVDPHRPATRVVCPITGDPTNPAATIPPGHQWRTITGLISLPASFTDPAGAWILPGIQLTVMPSPTSWAQAVDTWADHVRTWTDWQSVGINELSLTQTVSSARDVLVWSGSVAQLTASPAGDQAVIIDVSASDRSAPIANETIGDQPWPVHTLSTRAQRILRLARFDDFTLTVDPTLADTRLTARDVDAQEVLGLLQAAATSAGAVLWVADHATTGTYLWFEDPDTRTALRALVIDPGTGTVTISGSTRDVALISAADIMLEPLRLEQDSTAAITSVDVTWQDQQGTGDDGRPVVEAQTITRTDNAAADRHGLSKLQVDTELISDLDAGNLATRHLARARTQDWKLSGLTIDGRVMERPNDDVDDVTRLNTMIDLLDGTRRLGLPVTLLDLPGWTVPERSASGYLEGGTYTLNDGRWDLDLIVTSAGAQGETATWEQMPARIRWADLHDDISWADTYGVAAPTPTGAA